MTLRAFSWLCLLFGFCYLAFRLLAPWMHGLSPPPDPDDLTPWARIYAGDFDGAELPGMAALFGCYLGAAYFLVVNLPRLQDIAAMRFPALPWKLMDVAGVLPAAYIVLSTRSWCFTPLPLRAWKIHLVLAVSLAATALAIRFLAAPQARAGRFGRPAASAFWVGLGFFIITIGDPPSVHDYAFFLGPANKILHGEPWGSFYQQYGLGQTLLFAGMMKLGFPLAGMQAVLALIFAFWIFLYYRLARRLFRNQALVLIFMAALILFRVLAFRYSTLSQPQTSPLRMDLWVPLLLVWARYGFASPATALAFGAVYLLDNQFGALFCGLYLAALAAGCLLKHPTLAGRTPTGIALLALPALGAFAFQLLVYQSPISPAGSHYQSNHIGFLPIDPHSLFWPMAFLLGLSLLLIAPRRRPLHLFLFPVAAIELLYFFGRSHENALFMLSGIFLVIYFLALDHLAARLGRPAPAQAIAAVLIGCSVFLFEGGIWSRVAQAQRTLIARAWLAPVPEEIRADGYPDWAREFPGRKIIFVSPDDAYLYYRFGLPMPGFWSPLPGRVDRNGTSCYLRDRILAGDLVLVLGWTFQEDLAALGSSPELLASGWTLVPGREKGHPTLALQRTGP